MAHLSAECFYDQCGECRDGTCGDHCHEDEEFDLITGAWVTVDEEESDVS